MGRVVLNQRRVELKFGKSLTCQLMHEVHVCVITKSFLCTVSLDGKKAGLQCLKSVGSNTRLNTGLKIFWLLPILQTTSYPLSKS